MFCEFVEFKFVYYQLCFWIYHSSFLYIKCFGECEPFFFFFLILKRDFCKNMNTTEQNLLYLIKYTQPVFVEEVLKNKKLTLLCDQIKLPKCSPPHPERECRNMLWGVHVFEFKALYVFLFSFSSYVGLKFCQTCTGSKDWGKKK